MGCLEGFFDLLECIWEYSLWLYGVWMRVFFWLLLGFFFKMGLIFCIFIISHMSLGLHVRELMAFGLRYITT